MTTETKRHSMLVDLTIRMVKEKPLGTICAIITMLFIFTGIFADLLAPYEWNAINTGSFLKPPSSQYLLGTDQLGRDCLSRLIFGARISMIVGLSGTALATVVSVIIGLLSGFYGGKFDIVLQRFVDVTMCFPMLFIILSVTAVVGTGIVPMLTILGFTYGIRNSRVIRSAVLGIKANIYLEAARSIGCSNTKIIIRHIMPNVMPPIIIIFTVGVAFMIITEATLSFLGYGIPPPSPSWGGMLTIAGRRHMLKAPWISIWPGLALTIVSWSTNMLGDALRDILDPKLRGGLGRYGGMEKSKIKTLKGANK